MSQTFWGKVIIGKILPNPNLKLTNGYREHEGYGKQLRKGQKIEMEHTDDPRIARKIACDHLKEHPKYYTHLEKMERKMRRKNY